MANYLQKTKTPSEGGHSVIELVVAVGLMSIIAMGVVNFFSQVESGNAKSSARAEASSTNKALINLLKRDFKFSTSHQITANGKALTITRRQVYNAVNTNATYSVTFRSECANAPGGPTSIGKLVKDHYGSEAVTVFAAVSSKCLHQLSCPKGKFPRVVIDVNAAGSRIPVYAPRLYPDLSDTSKPFAFKKSAIGTALCVQESGSKIRAILETVYPVGTEAGQNTVAVVNDEILLSKSALSGLEVLPNQ